MFKLFHKQAKLFHCFCELAGWFLIPHNSVEIALQDTKPWQHHQEISQLCPFGSLENSQIWQLGSN